VKYNLPSENISEYLQRILFFVIIVVVQFTSLTETNAQIRPFDNGELITLSKGSLQSDTYYSNNKLDFDGTQHSLLTILRYGLAKNYELQMTWSAQKDVFTGKSKTSESTNIGLKVYLTEDKGYMPDLTAIVSANLTLDPKSNPFSPSVNLLYEKAINNTWCINGNVQTTLDEQAGDLSSNYSVNIEAAITPWQNTYVGLTGSTATNEKGELEDYQHYLEIGMLIWVADGITVYPFYDFGLNDLSNDIFNIGALFRLGR